MEDDGSASGHLSNEKKHGCLGYIGNYTTQSMESKKVFSVAHFSTCWFSCLGIGKIMRRVNHGHLKGIEGSFKIIQLNLYISYPIPSMYVKIYLHLLDLYGKCR